MEVFDDKELKRIETTKEGNDRMVDFFKAEREKIAKEISPIYDCLRLDFIENPRNGQRLLESQAESLSIRQRLHDQINMYLSRRGKNSVILKNLSRDKFMLYATGFGIKTSMGEKKVLIEAHIAENQRTIEIIESHVDYLRNCIKNLENYSYAIKNMIDLLNYLGK